MKLSSRSILLVTFIWLHNCFVIGQKCSSYLIVGAGIAGLGAAERLIYQHGIPGNQITIIEARNRTGGRIFTDSSSLGGPLVPGGSPPKVDLGASWIHTADPNRNPIRKYVDARSIATVADPDEFGVIFRSDASQYSDEEIDAAYAEAEADLEDAFASASTPARSSWPSRLTSSSFGQLFRASLEFDPPVPDSQWSVQRYLTVGEGCLEGPELIFPGGYSQVPDDLTQRLQNQGVTVLLGAQVIQVDYSADTRCGGATATLLAGGTISADAVIVAVPLGVLKAVSNSIAFAPPLPTSHSMALSRMAMGNAGKAAARFPVDFWSAEIGADTFVAGVELPGANDTTRGKFFQFFNMQKVLGIPILASFMSGEYMDTADLLSDSEIQDDFMKSLRVAFPTAPDPTHFVRTNWGTDPFARGIYTNWASTSSSAEDIRALSLPVSPNFAFAGEHTAFDYVGSVHGAYLSGMRAADNVATGTVQVADVNDSCGPNIEEIIIIVASVAASLVVLAAVAIVVYRKQNSATVNAVSKTIE